MVQETHSTPLKTESPDGHEQFVRNSQSKQQRASFSLGRAFGCAAEGFWYALRTQRNMKIHLLVLVLVVVLGLLFRIDTPAWLAVVLSCALVIGAECINTALESLVDLVSPEYHILAKRAKDCAAAAVLVCAVGAVVVGLIIFVPAVYALFAGV